jgi:putative ABC transport system ATP-binding protein
MSTNTPLAVKCRDLTKTYHTGGVDTFALRGIDLEVKSGELFMLAGPSGCGKTTLISIIAAILNHDQGQCSVFGSDLKQMSEAEKTRFRCRTIGFVFQAFNLIPTLSSEENIAIPLLIQGVERKIAIDRARNLLNKVGLYDKRNSSPRDLSGGQQQRVAVARALVHEPKLIVCDEPTSSLDKETGRQVMELFKQVALSDGRTLMIVTHDNRIFNFADRIALMNDGRVEGVFNSASEMTGHEGAHP